MLQRLELIGFKSFADKTIFEFSPGITAIVGPNGSGKSNVVDAVRWLMGEQSAKSLRGGEMTDVIFNGSATRKSLGMAEVTMVFDNRPNPLTGRGALNTDRDEVRITRRVYRDGVGEYLINNEICRLKDIKDLFLGSGAGSHAYSIIEQGRVDALLQSSPEDRRLIFEEASGISRFKARKTETLRKLERVEQNLQRLKDILAEVEKDLRRVRLQAAKAQRYQELTARLKELRIGLGLQEYHEHHERLTQANAGLEALRSECSQAIQRHASWHDSARQLDEQIAALDDLIHNEEVRLASARQDAAHWETTCQREQTLGDELQAELGRNRKRLDELTVRAEQLAQAVVTAREQLQREQQQRDAAADATATAVAQLAQVDATLQALRQQRESDQMAQMDCERLAAEKANHAHFLKARLDDLRGQHDRARRKSAEMLGTLTSLEEELSGLRQEEADSRGKLQTAHLTLAELVTRREEAVTNLDTLLHQRSEWRAERQGIESRVELLDRLERGHEGLGQGVREVLALLQQALEESERPQIAGAPDPLASVVIGLVADLLAAPHDLAPLIDLALGERSQSFVVRDGLRLADALASRSRPLPGRVSFLPIRSGVRLPALPAGAERLDTWVTEEPQASGLATLLLGRTLLVSSRAEALRLRDPEAGWRFITRDGDLLEADGTLTTGLHHARTGVLSRKSELRELRGTLVTLDHRQALLEAAIAEARTRLEAMERPIRDEQQLIAELTELVSELHARVESLSRNRTDLHEQAALSQEEIDQLAVALADHEARWHDARRAADEARQQAESLKEQLTRSAIELRTQEQERSALQPMVESAQAEMIRLQERLDGSHHRLQQLEADAIQRQREADRAAEHQRATEARWRESCQTLETATQALQAARAAIVVIDESTQSRLEERQHLRAQRRDLDERLRLAHTEQSALRDRLHACELQASELTHRRDALIQRLRDDYQVDLAALYSGSDAAVRLDPEAAQKEVEELRRSIARLGSPSLEALDELNEVEARAREMQAQYDDLREAQRSLTEIITSINADSRKLFTETFTAIRGHFIELFRKVFGGGQADIVLEENVDVLESGIEIVARPPGKELRSISLMSGGEKTMTAVALLLAIFRSKPSPFCLLDEVDAALDEANTERLSTVVREFSDRSQFIIITHHKRTMAAADVLYGVTMEESGVSRRVAVRFEDWPDESGQTEAA